MPLNDFQVRNHCGPLRGHLTRPLGFACMPLTSHLWLRQLIRVRNSLIWQNLWGGLLAALHLAMWQMLALIGAHEEGSLMTAFPGVSEGEDEDAGQTAIELWHWGVNPS